MERLRRLLPGHREGDKKPISLAGLINTSLALNPQLVTAIWNETLQHNTECIVFEAKKKKHGDKIILRSNYDSKNPDTAVIKIKELNPSRTETMIIHLGPEGRETKEMILRPGHSTEDRLSEDLSLEEKRSLYEQLSKSTIRKL